jgi:hypothetical protein
MRGRRAEVLQVGGWLALLAATLVVLASGGPAVPPTAPGRLAAWIGETPPVEAAFALVRLAALATTWYLVAVTVLGLFVRLLRAPRLAAATDRVTVPLVRRVLAHVGVATIGLAGGVAPLGNAPMAAAAQVPVATAPDTSTPDSTITMRRLPPDDESLRRPLAPPPTAGSEAPAPPAAAPPSSWTVRPGECLWTIADQVLAGAWGRPPSDEEVAPYWRTLVEANRSALADPSNADLVFPGQTFTVPAP